MRPLVLLHGFTGGPSTWDDVALLLGPGRRLVRPVLLGHGPVPWPSATSFEAEVDRLSEFVNTTLGPGAHLVGYSLGGRMALGMLVRHPGLVARATLIGASPGLPDPDARAARRREDEARARSLEVEGLAHFVDTWERLPLFDTQASVPEARRRARRAQRLAHDPAGLACSLRVCGLGVMPDLSAALARIDVPVTFVAGAQDPKFRALARSMASSTPHSTHREIPSAGHDVVLERPGPLASLLEELDA
jgi:2-succinyl-6-hydroxy-2,4-cyclohexadiene-1-carboxylate synthase